jgi:hypothetical protein
MLRLLAALPFLAACLIFVEREAPATLTVGIAEVDVTPKIAKDKPVYLAGFGKDRKATGTNDPIMARAIVLQHGKTKIALVSVDVVGLFLPFVEGVRKQLPSFAHVVVSSTHNHEGPDTLGLWGAGIFTSGIDKAYMTRLAKGIVDAVEKADAARVPVTEKINTVQVPELLHDNRLPIVKHDDLVVLTFEDAKKKPAGVVVQWNCHPETLSSKNTLLSADYVGYTVKHLRDKYHCGVVYLTGTVGGLMTSLKVPIRSETGIDLKDGTYEKTARYGVLLGQAAARAIDKAKPVTLTPFVVRTRKLYLPLANPAYVSARQFGFLDREAFLWKGDPDKADAMADLETEKPLAMRTELGYLRLGDLDIACIPGEIYPEIVLDKVQTPADPGADFPDAPAEPAIYKQLAGPHRMMIGLANDEIGYIIPKRQWDEKPPFAYKRKAAQYGEINSLGPETAPILCKAFAELVKGR